MFDLNPMFSSNNIQSNEIITNTTVQIKQGSARVTGSQVRRDIDLDSNIKLPSVSNSKSAALSKFWIET